MVNSVLAKHQQATNEEKYLALDTWRRALATERQKEIAWHALLRTVEKRASKHYNASVQTNNEDRALMLSRYLTENMDKPVRLLLSRYRQRFAAFEMVLELYGIDDILDGSWTVSRLVNQNRIYFMRQLARLQRHHNCWDYEQLVQLWLDETKKGDDNYAPSNHRLSIIRKLSEQLIDARLPQREYAASQLSPKERRACGL